MAANNIGGEVDLADPRDLADLGDVVPDGVPPKVEGDEDTPPKEKDKGDLPLVEGDELEEEDELEDLTEEEDGKGKEKEGEEDLEDEEEEPLSTGHERPSFKEISTKYPKFFKEFPAVREALGRERAYTEVFATVEDAKEAGEVIGDFRSLEQSILSGDSSVLLSNLHDRDEKALNKFAKNFLPTIQRGNPQLFSTIVTPYISRVLRNALQNAEAAGNKQLALAVGHIAKFVYGDPDGRVPDDPKEEKDNLEESSVVKGLAEENRKLAFNTLSRFASDIKNRTEKVIEKNILATIDPENALPEFMQEALVGKIIREIQQSLNADTSHTRLMTSLWNKAKKNGYTDEDRSQLISAFLARAKKILPSIRDKHKKEVLKKLASNPKDGTGVSRRRIPESGVPSRRQGNVKARDINWKKTSDEDILDDKYVPNRG